MSANVKSSGEQRSLYSMPRTWRETVARYAVDGARVPITAALPLAAAVRELLIELSDHAAVFTGKEKGRPLSGHSHAHILCESTFGSEAFVSDVNIFAPMGLDSVAMRALTPSWNITFGEPARNLRLVQVGTGTPQSFPDSRLFRSSSVWQSMTPFISTRYMKRYHDGRPKLDVKGRAIGSPEHDLVRLITAMRLPAPTKIQGLKAIEVGSWRLQASDFQMALHSENGGARMRPVVLRVTFPDAVTGPLAFGYGAHLGLGLFVPCTDREEAK